MQFEKIKYHARRVQHQLGKKLLIGERHYRVRGYLTNNLAVSQHHEQHLLEPFRNAMAATTGPVIDVGVNLGQTLLKVLSLDPSRDYLGIEPQIACSFHVNQFLADNNLTNFCILPLALGNETAMMPLYAKGEVDEMATLIPAIKDRRREGGVNAHFVPVRRGDEVLAEVGYGQPSIIKVDVEGAEMIVFESLRRTIERSRPICFFEVLPNFTGHNPKPVDLEVARAGKLLADDLWNFFTRRGYRIHQICPDGSEMLINRFELDDPAKFIGRDYIAHPSVA